MHINFIPAILRLHQKADMAFLCIKGNQLLIAFAAHGAPHGTKIKRFQKIRFPLCIAAVNHIDSLRRLDMQL